MGGEASRLDRQVGRDRLPYRPDEVVSCLDSKSSAVRGRFSSDMRAVEFLHPRASLARALAPDVPHVGLELT